MFWSGLVVLLAGTFFVAYLVWVILDGGED